MPEDCYEGGPHIIKGIHLRGKTDSLDLECSCGHKETWAEWYGTNFPGWFLHPKMVEVLSLFLQAQQEST